MACLVLCGFMVSVASAQDTKAAPRRGANIDQRIEQLDKELTLTADQKTKLKAYYEGVRKKNQDMRADTSLTREQRQEKMRAANEDLKNEMKSVLTADQFTKWEKGYDKKREDMKQKAKQNGKKAEEKTEK
jgi:Spy/CpxP family protein refolding chaperone